MNKNTFCKQREALEAAQEKFEAWFFPGGITEAMTEKNQDGSYVDSKTNLAWCAWQAAVENCKQGPNYEALYEQVCEQYNTIAQFLETKKAEPEQEPVMIYHGRHTIDCGEFGAHDMEMLKLIPAGTKLYASPQPREWKEQSEDGMTPIQHPQNLNQPVYKETADAIKEIEKLEGLCSQDFMASLRQCVLAMNAKMHSLEYKLQTRVWHELEKDDLAVIADALDVWTEDCVEMYKLISADLRAKNGL